MVDKCRRSFLLLLGINGIAFHDLAALRFDVFHSGAE